VTFWRDTRTPFRSDTGLTDAPATPNRALGAIRDRPSRPIPCRGQAAAVRVSGSNGLRRASSPFPDLPCSSASEHELDAFRPTSASHCFDYEYSRLFRSQHLSETYVSLSPLVCSSRKETGGPCASWRKGSASAGCSGSRVAFSSTHSRSCRASDIPVAPPKCGLAGFRARSKSPMTPRLRRQVPHEEQPTSAARDAFRRQLSRVHRGERCLEKRSREGFRFETAPVPFRTRSFGLSPA